jgi:hypothetical protein
MVWKQHECAENHCHVVDVLGEGITNINGFHDASEQSKHLPSFEHCIYLCSQRFGFKTVHHFHIPDIEDRCAPFKEF